MGRRRKYTARQLREAVDGYFTSISRWKILTEPVPTGETDRRGNPVMTQQPILSDEGEEMRIRDYAIPPTLTGLCRHLGIVSQTWSAWSDSSRYPEYADIVAQTRDRLRQWNEEQLLSRRGQDVKGIIFNLQANYGYSTVQTVELGPATRQAARVEKMSLAEKQALLQQIAREELGNGQTDTDGS